MKSVIVVDHHLPVGLIANTAAVLAMSIGKKRPEIIGADVKDRQGSVHRGITQAVVPVLKGDGEQIRGLREKLEKMDAQELFFVDFCDVAQRSTDYGHYTKQLEQTPGDQLAYLGIAICGPVKKVNSLTGSMALLR